MFRNSFLLSQQMVTRQRTATKLAESLVQSSTRQPGKPHQMGMKLRKSEFSNTCMHQAK